MRVVSSFKVHRPGMKNPVMYAEMSDGTYAKATYSGNGEFSSEVISKDEYASALLEHINNVGKLGL